MIMPGRLLLALSVRNLMRQRRRNGMLLLAIGVAVACVTLSNSLVRGMQDGMRRSAVESLTGDIKILKPGYRDDPGIDERFDLASGWTPEVPAAELAGWAPRLRVPAVIMSERETRGVELVGIEPGREDISFVGRVRIEGSRLDGGADNRVLIGKALAEQLETGVGYRLVIITEGADGQSRESGFRVAGVYDADGTGLEKTYVFTGITFMRSLLDTDGVTEVSIRLKDDSEAALSPVLQGLKDRLGGLDVLPWQALEPQAAAMFVFADAAVYILFVILMGALVFGLMNVLITAVLERIPELGMLRAVGMRPGVVVAQVVLESTLIMLAGICFGLLLGAGLVTLLADGIDLSQWSAGAEVVGMGSVLIPRLSPADVTLVAGMSLGLGFIASLYPAWRAVKINPLEALRR